jgi:hypothetical protein
MRHQLERCGWALAGIGMLILTACGGGGGSTPVAPAPTTTSVSTTVVDGALQNVVVCVDKNSNGKCDSDETQGTTDASGNVTLAVPNADVGKFPIVAVVGTNAIDAVNGPVTAGYAMSAPADQTGVVSPLTTLVQQTVASTGVSTAAAATSVQNATGIATSLFQDFTKIAAPTDGSINAATVARMLVVSTQQQQTILASTLGTAAVDGSTISQADLDKAIQKKLLELLPLIVTAVSDPAVLAAATPAARETALLAAATALVASSGLTPAAVPVVVAINNQAAVTPPSTPPAAFIQLANLTFTDASNYFVRLFTGSLAQNTPDANNNGKYVDRRASATSGNVARWGSGNSPARNADLNWNGTAWVGCPINFENTSSVRDAQGNSTYSYCDQRETGKTSRATFDIGGKTMASVYAQIIAAGYTNLTIANPAVLGTATFPTGSSLFYQTNTPLTEAFAYYPAGANNPAGFGNIVTQYSASVAAGGDATTQAAGTACNATETNTNGSNSTTLEGMIATKTGTPCVYPQGSFVYGGVTYLSPVPNEWWGNSTVNIGTLGSVPLNTGTAPGYLSGNTLLRVAFKGTGTNPVTYYACGQRFTNSSARNCLPIGTGSYSIQTLADGRVLTLTNPPAQAAPLNYNRVFVERGGFVYFGYQSKQLVTSVARLNTIAATALLNQLGLTPEDPSVPLALTAASYQGTWDSRNTTTAPAATNGTTVFINADGSVSCQDRPTSASQACTVTITNPATGAFTYTNGMSTASGTFDFQAGTASGTFHDPTVTPTDGNFIAGRR